MELGSEAHLEHSPSHYAGQAAEHRFKHPSNAALPSSRGYVTRIWLPTPLGLGFLVEKEVLTIAFTS